LTLNSPRQILILPLLSFENVIVYFAYFNKNSFRYTKKEFIFGKNAEKGFFI